jgi:tellurite methyltransferase
MPIQDAHRWNERYRENKHFSTFNSPRAFLIEHADLLPKQGLALDAAMGLGGNAGFLLERGLKVIGVDISEVAVRQAKARMPELMAVEADLTQFYLPDNTFDVIINFFYLQRDLWPQYVRALRPGGWLVLETLTHEMHSRLPDTDPRYLLAAGELRRAFENLEIVAYREGWSEGDSGHTRATASLLARKPSP